MKQEQKPGASERFDTNQSTFKENFQSPSSSECTFLFPLIY